MNKQYILNLAGKVLNREGNLEFYNFEKFFGALDENDQEEIEYLLNDNGIYVIYEIGYDSEPELNPRGSIMIDKNIHLSNEQLCVLYQQGNPDALSSLILKNKKLIYSRAIRYSKRYNHKHDLDDLLQSGYIGLLIAANKFDNSLGFKFTTYAINWIDQRVTRDIVDYGYTVRIPVHVFEKIMKMQRVIHKNEGLTTDKIREILNIELGYDDEYINFLQILSNHIMAPATLSTPIGEEGDTYLGDLLEDKTTESVEDEIELIFLREEIKIALENLKSREKEIIELRFGLDGSSPKTLEEIGNIQNVTRERIRQIEEKALRKLRESKNTKHLRGYLING